MTESQPALDSETLEAFAHDLRAYLRVVGVVTQRMLARVGEEADAQSLRQILESTRDIESLVFATVRYGCAGPGPGAERKPGSLPTLIAGVLLQIRPEMQAISGELEISGIPPCQVSGEFAWVLKELLGNAIKFRAERPLKVAVAFQIEAQHVVVTVSDNGLGIDPKYEAEIFRPYRRLHGRGVFPGNGLGLATARRMAEAAGGSLRLSPVSEGACFVTEWPCLEGSAQPAAE